MWSRPSFEIYDKPRAITFDHEAMRIFQACGLADRIAEFTAPHPGTHYLGIDGRVIKKFESLPPPYPLAWPPTSTFVQPEVERLLRDGVAGSAAVDVFLGHRAVAFTQDEQGVTLTVRDVTQGKERVLRGRTLLGCDGANSFVRKRLDIALEDLGFDEWWMVVDARHPPSRRICRREASNIAGRRGRRPSSTGPAICAAGRSSCCPESSPRNSAGTRTWSSRSPASSILPAVEIWRSAVYRFHALLAERWRHGRVFLLGDACHQTPPFLGQGMCAGIRDAGNLAWKLAMVLQEGAPDALLDSYEQERKPHVRTLVATAKEFGADHRRARPRSGADPR